MSQVIWLLGFCTAALAGPSHYGENFQEYLHTIEEIGKEFQQESSLDKLSALIDDWTAFKDEYKRTYGSEEVEQHRIQIFADNRRKIAAHNELYKKGLTTYFMDINEFADMTDEEFIKTMTGYIKSEEEEDSEVVFKWNNRTTLPSRLDWRDHGAVTPVKSQGHCGSCWAFAATGALEGRSFLKNGHLISLSEQNLLDCSTERYGNNGCKGGYYVGAFSYIRDNWGIETEYSYPYEAVQRQCRYDPSKRGGWDGGSVRVEGGEPHLLGAVGNGGPVAVVIDSRLIRFYRGGVFYNSACSSYILDHAVLVTGYGNDAAGGEYWLIKNSWGPRWGMEGYLKLARNRQNHCGVATNPVFPIV